MKKVYIEITNNCNLNCSFCTHNKREPKYIGLDEFKIILSKLKGYTNYLYLHVLGEPLLHPLINELINEASKDFYVNITTNGTLIENIKDNKNIRQLNISLHSCNFKEEEYLTKIFAVTDVLKEYTFINYRLWTSPSSKIISLLENKYQIKINGSQKLDDNVYLDFAKEFVWPSLDNDIHEEYGKCYALRDHIGILVDGTVVPCCLDADGVINLGNIFDDNLNDILSSNRCLKMRKGFEDNKLTESLCKHCGFINKLKRKGDLK